MRAGSGLCHSKGAIATDGIPRQRANGVLVMYYVYMLTNKYNKVLYTGVTNNLQRRLYEHLDKSNEGFSARYNTHKLVYIETTSDVKAAIQREKQIKNWGRAKKDALINSLNPEWRDLSEDWKE
jgi:putative endonuclease